MTDIGDLKRGTVELVSEEELQKKLSSGRALRVKLGVDPTSPDLHLGHSVVLQKLRAFQDRGHTAVLIIGDFTARVGDPSGRDSTRPTLTEEAIRANAKTYQDQAFKVLLRDKTELRWNSEWLDPFFRGELMGTLRRCTVQQLLAREDFQNRMKSGTPISLLEILYPVLQGQDSVAVRADVELGGNDQLFNLLFGRRMQQDAGQEPQVALTVPLLRGLDGQKKMSKSYGNHIGLTEPAREMFGKLMSLSDELMWEYFELLTCEDVAAMKARHPLEAKKALARIVTSRYHGEDAARSELEFFEKTFSRKEAPEDVPELVVTAEHRGLTLSAFLHRIGAAESRKAAQRLLTQGAVRLEGAQVRGDDALDKVLEGRSPAVLSLKVGKHSFYKLKLG